MSESLSLGQPAPSATRRPIAIFMPTFERGGTEKTVIRLMRGFLEAGHPVDFLTVRADDSLLEWVPSGVRIVWLKGGFWFPTGPGALSSRISVSLRAFWPLVSYLRTTSVRAVLSVQSSAVAVLARMAARRAVRLVVRESNDPMYSALHTAALASWRMRLVKRLTYPRADGIVSLSAEAGRNLARVLGVPQERITQIYNPTFDPTIRDEALEDIDHPWFRDGQPPVIVGVGRLAPQKDFPTLLRAFAYARARVACRLVILGEGRLRADLEALACSLGVREDVDFPGYCANPYKFLARSRLFVLSSAYEGLPNALIEAATLGVPVVSTDCPSGPREILLDGTAGVLVPVGDHVEMGEATVRLLSDPALAQRYVEECQKGLHRFSLEGSVSQYLDVLGGGTAS